MPHQVPNLPGPNMRHQYFAGDQFAATGAQFTGARFTGAQFATPEDPFAGAQFVAKKGGPNLPDLPLH